MRRLNWLIKYLLLLGAAVWLLGCSKLTQENYNKVKPSMSLKQVEAILGAPTSVENINISGFSGTSVVWKNNAVEIDIQFLNDNMVVKSFNKISDK